MEIVKKIVLNRRPTKRVTELINFSGQKEKMMTCA